MFRKLAGSYCINPQNKKFAFLHKNANFKGVRVGRSLHFEHMLEIRTSGYLFHPHVNLKIKNYQKSTKIIYFPSIPPSIKPTKIKHFTTFHTIKNHHYSTTKISQTPTNQAFSRTCPKITHIVKKISHHKLPNSISKITRNNSKIKLFIFQHKSKSTLLSKIKNLSQHKTYLTFN